MTTKKKKKWKNRMDKQHVKRIRRARRRPTSGNTHRFTQNDTKNIKLENARPWWNTWFLIQEINPNPNRLALEMNRCLQGAHVPKWITKGKTTKDPSKGTVPNYYRPITSLPMMWEILTAQKREKIYYSLTSRGLFPDEQKGCHKGSRDTAELLWIAQHIPKEGKIRRNKSC